MSSNSLPGDYGNLGSFAQGDNSSHYLNMNFIQSVNIDFFNEPHFFLQK